jgi:hypothetical protein
MSLVSFDFDGTLQLAGRPAWPGLHLFRAHQAAGDQVIICTVRTEAHEAETWWRLYDPTRIVLQDFLEAHDLRPARVLYTAHTPKAPHLRAAGCALHYDDDPMEAEICALESVPCVLLKGILRVPCATAWLCKQWARRCG